MIRFSLFCVALALASPPDSQVNQPPEEAEEAQPASQATTQPATSQPARGQTLRRPAQAEIIEKLLRDRERPTVILPEQPDGAQVGQAASQPATGADEVLLVEGTILVERRGRLAWQKGRPAFAFLAGGRGELETMELLPNQLLEAMEQEAERGTTDFVISARVTRYKGRNYLLLLKVLRRVSHGNLGP